MSLICWDFLDYQRPRAMVYGRQIQVTYATGDLMVSETCRSKWFV